MIIFGMFGWAITTVLQGKKLHCGGTQDLDLATRDRYIVQAPAAVVLVGVSLVLLTKEHWYLYYACMFLLVCCFVGELGWGNAFRIFISIF